MELLDTGMSHRQVADGLPATASSVCLRREGGDDTPAAKPHPGRPKKLDEHQVGKLVTLLVEGPRRHGFADDRRTLPVSPNRSNGRVA